MKFGEIGIRKGWLSSAQVKEALARQREQRSDGWQPLLGQVLYHEGHLHAYQLKRLIALQGLHVIYCLYCRRKYTLRKYTYRKTRCPSCGALVVTSRDLLDTDAAFPTPVTEVNDSPVLDLEIGEFELRRKLSTDANSLIFEAYQGSKERQVIFKIWDPDLTAHRDFTRQVINRVQAVARLRHPRLARIYSLGKSKGFHYVAMEYMPGQPLEYLLARDGALPYRQAISLIIEVARGLAYAHAQEIFHGNLDPSRIWISPQGEVKVFELGLILDPMANFEKLLGYTTRPLPFYFAPEQVTAPTELQAQTDIFSLGCIFYHLLSGKPLYQGRVPMKILTRMSETRLTPFTKFQADIPPVVDEVLNRMICLEPPHRFASMSETLQVLEKLQDAIRMGMTAGESNKTSKIR